MGNCYVFLNYELLIKITINLRIVSKKMDHKIKVPIIKNSGLGFEGIKYPMDLLERIVGIVDIECHVN